MVERFQIEDYRNYLVVLARVQLATADWLRNKVDASDVAQEAIVRATRAGDQFHGASAAEYKAWLLQILTNVFTDQVRHFRRDKRDALLEVPVDRTINGSVARMELLADQTSPSGHFDRHERGQRLADALLQLPEDQRTAVMLKHLGGLSLAETAERMERTNAAVAGLLRRGLKALRQLFEVDGG